MGLYCFYLGKKGPIYSVEWNPKRDEFIVVYGSNLKNESICIIKMFLM